ncbi:shufflon system plasmid conjugative transfer pilus tip adhesin PilV [Bordetella pseudohinzii]|uniref:Bacterial shufflon protein, N-terminal constant region n=1 Tax=Bordetella pseudohinzii TaxID=1331258 RepID=A0A0J6BZF2_9BORD|nr:shufflon system plasmid conjugative transfer pilus tip adhesin PilV [Bordetella pseudohinzii]ANY18506.1 hypothetical protein BBN53_21010 [Bordetella pseudohinzii]KMM24093.1 hypothetical protein L540_08170 [Bordetella pseudohinzii]KXA77841.1 hypothetical protein AW878_14185 [Bordetella pseudohinzii]KXA78037.1 hypothetical protein AW877_12645 [Bordetella pseudohinzii]CUJ13839.1 Bacterial shufflon protein%2C N-terminal constant region [Bordetella pseudohinzii]
MEKPLTSPRRSFTGVRLSDRRGLSPQRGEGLWSFILALGLMVALWPIAMTYMGRAADLEAAAASAFHATQIGQARDSYVKDNYAAILASAASGPVSISTPMLKNSGYLDAGISDTNIQNQTYQTRAIRVTVGGEELLRVLTVTSGGEPFTEAQVRSIANKIAQIGGGYVSSTNTAVAEGAQGSYRVALSDYGLAPGAGHIAIGGFFNARGVLGDYLYRNAIPNHPELNQMNTALSLGGNAINSVSSLTASGAITTAGDVQGRDLLAARNINAQGNVAATGTVSAATVSASTSIVSAGSVNATGTVGGGYLQPVNFATEGYSCGTTGLIARSSTGAVLSCTNGLWRRSTSEFEYGGVFSYFYKTGQCPVPNRYTGGCSCPSGYAGTAMAQWTEGSGLTLYVCER